MGTPGRRLPTTLALLAALAAALAAAPGRAQDTEEECPYSKGTYPSPDEVRRRVWAHQEWLDKRWMDPAAPGRMVLCETNLSGAQLQGVFLTEAQLHDAVRICCVERRAVSE